MSSSDVSSSFSRCMQPKYQLLHYHTFGETENCFEEFERMWLKARGKPVVSSIEFERKAKIKKAQDQIWICKDKTGWT